MFITQKELLRYYLDQL